MLSLTKILLVLIEKIVSHSKARYHNNVQKTVGITKKFIVIKIATLRYLVQSNIQQKLETNMAKKYLKLKHEHFGKGQQYQQIFKNNVKVT